ncbi:hypothetical protein BDZ91DRAFT_658879, partial [Kalaharituber pfeilii]
MPLYLRNLTLVEEQLIAPCKAFGFIAKLVGSSPVHYRHCKGHMIVVPQNVQPLFKILPSRDLRLSETIKVMWVGKSRPSDEELRPTLQVRRDVVLNALLGLKRDNNLFRDVEVDHELLNS